MKGKEGLQLSRVEEVQFNSSYYYFEARSNSFRFENLVPARVSIPLGRANLYCLGALMRTGREKFL